MAIGGAPNDRMAVLAGLFAGLCFGIFWLPLRMVEDAGIAAPWAQALFLGLPALICLPLGWYKRLEFVRGGAGLLGGILTGVAFALYAAALLYTDVVRAVLLFYLLPIWGFLLGWILLGDRITAPRWLAIGLGIVGMAIIFADDTGIPLPRNIGDWFGLASGLCFALGCTLILTDKRVGALTHTVNFFVVGAALSIAVAWVMTARGHVAAPGGAELATTLVWLAPVSILLILPAGFATIYAPARLNPGVVGLLFMTEIAVAVCSAALLADESIGLREVIGLPLILCAGLIEPVLILRRARVAV